MKRTFLLVSGILSLLVTLLSLQAADRSAQRQAQEVLEAAGIKGGLIVHLGCGDGTLTAALQAKATPASAVAETSGRSTDYQRPADIVALRGYEWLIGKWSGNENNQTYALEYKPILDKHAAFVDMKIGDFKYLGLIMYAASRQEAVEFGADTLGRTWLIVWEQTGGDLANKSKLTKPDGATQKLQHVFTKIDNDTFKVKLYGVGTDGSRESEPREQVTFKREKQAPRPT